MAFSYTLFLGLILLFPGFCAWAALRISERADLLTPRPDRPNSTATLFVVILGTLAGHLLGAAIFALQALWCSFGPCFTIAFDPNVYRVLITSGRTAGEVTDLAVLVWLLELALFGFLAGGLIVGLSRISAIRSRWDAIDYGWLDRSVREAISRDAVILAYVVTKTSHEGASVAYEGIIQQLALDDDQTINMLVLRRVDRFLVRITKAGFERIDDDQPSIAQMQLHLAEIANVALEVIERPSSPGSAPAAAQRKGS